MLTPDRMVFVAALAGFCTISCHDRSLSGMGAVPHVTPRIVRTVPHDSLAFTQGLFYDDGRLYESTGLYGRSSLRILDAENGAKIRNQPVATVFAEGCARLGNELFQLTWQEHTAFVYSFPDLTERRTTIYAGEGWGLASDGKQLYMSTGSDTLFVRDRDFAITRKIPVRANGQPVTRLNELEYVNGCVYANVWYTDHLLEINARNGNVSRIIDCAELVKKESPSSPENVLNGIAYNPQTREFYVTGKNWKTIFVVEIPGK